MTAPADPNALVAQAIAAGNSGDKAAAQDLLAQALKLDPHNARAWYVLSQVVQGNERAIYCLRRAIEYQPDNQLARERLAKLDPTFPPQPVAPRSVQAMPVQATQPQPGQQTNSMSTIIVVLLIILGLYWIAVGMFQIFLAVFGAELIDASMKPIICGAGLFNIFISIVNFSLLRDVLHRYRQAVKNITGLAVLGAIIGLGQLVLMGAYLQICAVPLYIVLGVLIQITKDEYTQPTPAELRRAEQLAARQQAAQKAAALKAASQPKKK